MTHDEAFLADIAEHPADDAPRLIYADWLEEHGGAAEAARAAFIRGQCRLARMSFQDPARAALEDECTDLLAEHEEEWTAPVRGVAQHWEFQRGFIERIEVRDDVFVKHADSLMLRTPLREVAFQLTEKDSKALAGCRQLERLETLVARNQHLRDSSLQPLLTSAHLKRLTALNLAGNNIEGPAVQALLQENRLARLRRLDLNDNYTLGDRAARTVVTSEQAAGLEVLCLGGTNITAAGLQEVFASRCLRRLAALDVGVNRYNALAGSSPATVLGGLVGSPLLPRLVSLNFSGWVRGEDCAALVPLLQRTRLAALYLRRLWMTDREASVLANLSALSTLSTLDLAQSHLGGNGATAMAHWPHLANLTGLDLSFNDIRDRGARALASSPHLRHLRLLILRRSGIGGPGVTALTQSSNLQHLRWLDLAGNYINAASVRAVTRSPYLEDLTTLDLGDTRIGPDSAAAFGPRARLTRLERLFLDSNDLGDKGAVALAAAPVLRRLKLLNLRDTELGKAGAEALAASPHLGQLRHLDVRENRSFLSDDEIHLLRQRFGKAVQDEESDD